MCITKGRYSSFVYRDHVGCPALLPYIQKIHISTVLCTQSGICLHRRLPMVKIWRSSKNDQNWTSGKLLKLIFILLLLLLLFGTSYGVRTLSTAHSLVTPEFAAVPLVTRDTAIKPISHKLSEDIMVNCIMHSQWRSYSFKNGKRSNNYISNSVTFQVFSNSRLIPSENSNSHASISREFRPRSPCMVLLLNLQMYLLQMMSPPTLLPES